MELKIGHINEINVWLIPLMAICCMGSCRFSSGIFYFINIYSSLSKDRYLCCLWSQWICITLSEHLHGAHSIHKAELKFLHLKPWHHKEIWFRVKIWFRVQILLEKKPRLFRTGASFQIDQNWEHLHFAGEIPTSQRCFFPPSSFPLHLSYIRTLLLSRKHSRGHKNLPIPPPRQRRLCPCAPPIPEDGCAKSRDAQLT